MRRVTRFLTGLTFRDFKGIPSLKEVVCSGELLQPEVKLISLKLYRELDQHVLASLNVLMNNCVTFGDYASCYLNLNNTHRSRLRILVFDLEEGESRKYGCTVTTVNSLGDAMAADWKVLVNRRSKWGTVVKWNNSRCWYLL